MINQNEISNNLKNLLDEIKKEVLFNKNFKKANEMISCFPEQDNIYLKDCLAFLYFQLKNYSKAKILYNELGKHYQEGFCELLLGNQEKTAKIWHSCINNPAVHWGKCLLGFINLRIDYIPSFLQIRNFLERDIEYFLIANKLEYAENLISCEDFLADINLETYKFIGKALLNNGYQDLSHEQFIKSRNLMPNDPEIYYYLAQYAYYNFDYKEVKLMLEQCLELNENYTPAKNLLNALEQAF